jgi:hypothetical protein
MTDRISVPARTLNRALDRRRHQVLKAFPLRRDRTTVPLSWTDTGWAWEPSRCASALPQRCGSRLGRRLAAKLQNRVNVACQIWQRTKHLTVARRDSCRCQEHVQLEKKPYRLK